MIWVAITIALLILIVYVSVKRPWGQGFDATIAPPPDLRRADDPETRGLQQHDGTGGFL